MSELDQALSRLMDHPGVEQILLLGGDGLLVRRLGGGHAADVDTVAAMVPGLGSACAALGRAAAIGSLGTAVLDFQDGVVVVAPLSSELLLTLVLRPGVGFAELLRALRRERSELARLL